MERLTIILLCVTMWYAIGLAQFYWFAHALDNDPTVKPPEKISTSAIYIGALVGPLPILYLAVMAIYNRTLFLFEGRW